MNWRTVENHLVYLRGKMLVREVFASPFVRIYELSTFGKDHLKINSNGRIKIGDKKLIDIRGEQP